MPTKRSKHKTTGEKITAAEVAARREELTLRRARNQQRRIRQLARSLANAIVAADVVRVECARSLCEGTGWGVFGTDEWDNLTKRTVAAEEVAEHMKRRVADAEGRVPLAKV